MEKTKEQDDEKVPPTDLGEQTNPPGRAHILKGKIELHTTIELDLEGDPLLVNKTYEVITRTATEAHRRAAERADGRLDTESSREDPAPDGEGNGLDGKPL